MKQLDDEFEQAIVGERVGDDAGSPETVRGMAKALPTTSTFITCNPCPTSMTSVFPCRRIKPDSGHKFHFRKPFLQCAKQQNAPARKTRPDALGEVSLRVLQVMAAGLKTPA
jgi:hypothetical protein